MCLSVQAGGRSVAERAVSKQQPQPQPQPRRSSRGGVGGVGGGGGGGDRADYWGRRSSSTQPAAAAAGWREGHGGVAFSLGEEAVGQATVEPRTIAKPAMTMVFTPTTDGRLQLTPG